MTTGPDQLAAQLALALLLLVVAGLLVTRMLRAIPGAGWIAQPVPGRGLLRRAIGLLLLLILVGLLLDALTGDRGRDERLPVFVVSAKRTPAIAAHIRAAQAAGKPAILHRLVPVPRDRRPGACRGWRGPGSCDEYPFASTIEGGVASRWWWKSGGRGSGWACYAAVVTGSVITSVVGGANRSRRRSWSSRVAAGV